MMDAKRWRGLVALVRDAVEHGSRAVEKVQIETAGRPFGILEQIPAVAEPTRVVHVLHDATVSGVHGVVRAVARAVGATVDVALRVAEEQSVEDEHHGRN
jgi:hydrogenase maturation factor